MSRSPSPPGRPGRARTARTTPSGRMSRGTAKGLFRPLPPSHPAVFYPGKGKPSGRRAKAVKNWTDAGCPDVPPK
jgi:hypothetical protein